MAQQERFQAAAKRRMERKGTVGSLRAIAQRRGLLSGKEDTLTPEDLRTLYRSAQREDNAALIKKVVYAANVHKPPVKLPAAKSKK